MRCIHDYNVVISEKNNSLHFFCITTFIGKRSVGVSCETDLFMLLLL